MFHRKPGWPKIEKGQAEILCLPGNFAVMDRRELTLTPWAENRWSLK
jgi:hypothetical protein